MDLIPYFAYGTTQKGFAHHDRLADLLGEPAGRFRTASAHAVVVPRRAACSNPGCLRTPGHAPPHDVIDPLDDLVGAPGA